MSVPPSYFPQQPPPPPPPPPPREDPPTSPYAPGLSPSDDVQRGDNQFQLGIEGPDPNLAVGGSHDQQEGQRDKLLALATLALGSYTTGHTPATPRVPNDGQVEDILNGLNPNPPIGTDGEEVTHAVYQSQIPNATAAEGYDHFVNNPNEVFNAGGMEIRPPTDRLEDGGRYMLEIGTPVPTWLPVQINLDPASNAISIQTLDGHVLRGEQTFTFTDDGNGGAVLTQDARFQASSRLPEELQQITPIATGQHIAWQNAHQEIYGQFNGDPDFKGIGTDFSPGNLLESWGQALGNVIKDPGNAADVGVDVVGELANFGVDGLGSGIDTAFDYLNIPGGDTIQDAFDSAGDLISNIADKIGDGAEAVIDFVNPFD
ncbi:DUF1990 family protein [Luteimonas panaciterrae]|uniref:DUF1990 family protein n=1 Tax=Luteimonas panaciterrae TaxID=363885 RepID=UPI001CFA44F2|nr:DUF1990 family protein [Luteimonas panaciterrae]